MVINGKRIQPTVELMEFLWGAVNFRYLKERNFQLNTTRTFSLSRHSSLICLILLGFIFQNIFHIESQDYNFLILYLKKGVFS